MNTKNFQYAKCSNSFNDSDCLQKPISLGDKRETNILKTG